MCILIRILIINIIEQHKTELLETVRILENMGYKLYASLGTADFYTEHGIKIRAIEWPYEDKDSSPPPPGNGQKSPLSTDIERQRDIANYLADNKFDLVINLATRDGGSRAASSFITQGYRTRRMAIDYSIPLITDVKIVKLFVEVRR